jgi:hypothetical protein
MESMKEKVMVKHPYQLRGLCTLMLVGSAAISSPVIAQQCCPSGGVGSPKSVTGLGQSSPQAANLSIDPAWRVYQFERQGVHYLQINDYWGVARVGIGRIGTTAWILPMGADVDRVSLPGDAVPIGAPKTIFLSKDEEIVLYQNGSQQHWVIRLPQLSNR